MSKKDLDVQGMDQVQEEVSVEMTEKQAQKAAEKQAAIEAGAEKLAELGVSEEFAILLNLATKWNAPAEEKQAAKEAAIEAFGGSDKLKAYATEKMDEEIAEWKNIDKTLSVMNNIKHFYAKRKSSGSKKTAMKRIKIGNDFFSVSAAYLNEIADKPRDEKRELVLAHPMTVKEEVTEL